MSTDSICSSNDIEFRIHWLRRYYDISSNLRILEAVNEHESMESTTNRKPQRLLLHQYLLVWQRVGDAK